MRPALTKFSGAARGVMPGRQQADDYGQRGHAHPDAMRGGSASTMSSTSPSSLALVTRPRHKGPRTWAVPPCGHRL